jgi:hypothetical protein
MAKFGLFTGPKKIPDQTFEGDYMQQDKEYVYIKKRNPNTSLADEQTAAVKLGPGQSVTKITD